MYQDTPVRAVLFTACCALSMGVSAQLKPISDQEMSNVTGQAMVAVDYVETGIDDFTRFTLGMDTEVQTNVNKVALGEVTDTSGNTAADLDIDNLSLGHIATDASKVQLDGKTYAVGDIVPFVGIDPYFELAK